MPTIGQVYAAVLENIIIAALQGERDEEGHLSPEAQEEIDRYLAILDDPEALEELQQEEGEEGEEGEADEEPPRPHLAPHMPPGRTDIEPEFETGIQVMSWQGYTTRGGNPAWLNLATGERYYGPRPPGYSRLMPAEQSPINLPGDGAEDVPPTGPDGAPTNFEVAARIARDIEEEYKGDKTKLKEAHRLASGFQRMARAAWGGRAPAVVGAAMIAAHLVRPDSATAAALAILFLGVYGGRGPGEEGQPYPTADAAKLLLERTAKAAGEEVPAPEPTTMQNLFGAFLTESEAMPREDQAQEPGTQSVEVPEPQEEMEAVRMSHEREAETETVPDGGAAAAEGTERALKMAAKLRRRLVVGMGKKAPVEERLSKVHSLLDQWHKDLLDLLTQSYLAGSLLGQLETTRELPDIPPASEARAALESFLPQLRGLDAQGLQTFMAVMPPSYQALLRELEPDLAKRLPPQPATAGATFFGDTPPLKLPLVEEAVAQLRERQLLSEQDYRALETEARQRAFAVAGLHTAEAAGLVRDLLAKSLEEGPDLRKFKREAERVLGKGVLSDKAVRTVFRTGVQEAYSKGLDRLLARPLVGDEFPYEETLPIRDSRLSEMCEVCSRSGIQGTAIYRRDDPTWARIKPPRHYNCRCSRSPVSVRMAAKKGIEEAVQWLQTGEPPRQKAWVPMPDINQSQLLK